jgi:hypothetical protein
MADPAQQLALRGADQVISRGDELDNHVEMTGYNWLGNLRTELGAGNDFFNSGRGMSGENVIVGQHGGDTINLTYRDFGRDVVVYQTVNDGRTADVVQLRYSDNDDDYREGSRISVIINGRQYEYTTSDHESVEEALQNFAASIMEKQVTGRVVIGLRYETPVFGEPLSEPTLVYQDEMQGVMTPSKGPFPSSVTLSQTA